MEPGPYINELLFRYDCVIIPGFGGFVGNYAPARIHPVQHRFYPPCKRITFNRHLQNNDGLLANLISQDTGCSFEKAMELIHSHVRQIEKELKEGKRVVIDKIGMFTMDIEKNIQFEPNLSSNYLLDSYGLLTFQVLPVQSQEEKIQETPAKEIPKEVPVLSIERKNELARLGKLAIAASVLFTLIWIPLRTDLLEEAHVGTTISKLFHKETPLYQPRTDHLPVTAISPETPGLERELENTGHSIAWSFLDREELAEGTPSHLFIAPEPAAVKASTPAGPYHVVGGCFEYIDNAETLVNRLKQKGYPALIAGKRHGLFVVSYGSFGKRNEALELLREVKRLENEQAWLLRN